jgi:hypothetical protein
VVVAKAKSKTPPPPALAELPLTVQWVSETVPSVLYTPAP